MRSLNPSSVRLPPCCYLLEASAAPRLTSGSSTPPASPSRRSSLLLSHFLAKMSWFSSGTGRVPQCCCRIHALPAPQHFISSSRLPLLPATTRCHVTFIEHLSAAVDLQPLCPALPLPPLPSPRGLLCPLTSPRAVPPEPPRATSATAARDADTRHAARAGWV